MIRATLAVSRRELLAYFLSPISYLIAALFLVVQGYSFFLLCQAFSTQRATTSSVMQYFFGGTFLYWLFLIFVVAVLTMRLIAEERQRGTLEPLLTAPVAEGAIALGKYLGALGFYLFLWAPTLAYVGLLRAYAGGHVGAYGGDWSALDPGPIAAGYLGTLLCGFSAIGLGLLASALCKSQVLAAVLCFTLLSLLLLGGMLADLYVRNETVRQVLLYVNLFRHMDELARGIVDSRRVIYHLLLGMAAVFLAGRTLVARPGDVGGGARAAAEGVLVLGILVGLNVLAARHVHRADWTHAHQFTLSPRTVSLLDDLRQEGKTLHVTVFQADNGDRDEVAEQTRELLLRAERAGQGVLKVERLDVDRDRDRVRLLGEQFHINKDDIRQGVTVVECEGRSKFIQPGDLADYEAPTGANGGEPGEPPRLLAFRGEEALDSAMLTVATGKTPQLCFTKGHGEAEFDSFTGAGLSDLTETLRRDNYQARGLESLQAAPTGCDVLIIAGPQRAFLPDEAKAVAGYLDGGGRLLLLLGPLMDRGLTRFIDSGLEDVLRLRGVRLGRGVVIEPDKRLGDTLAFVVDEGYGDHPVSAPLLHQRTLWTMARPVKAMPTVPLHGGALWVGHDLVLTGEHGFGETDLEALRQGQPAYTAGADEAGPVAIAAAASVKDAPAGGRLVVLGSSQLGTNEAMGLYNRDLLVGAVAWLARADGPRKMIVEGKRPDQLRLVLEQDQLTRLFLVVMCGMPLMALLLGAGVFWLRRS